jgi:hypothetical protein
MGEKIEDIYNLFIEMTGMSRKSVQNELNKYIDALNLDKKSLTEHDLRKIMSLYLEDLNWSIMVNEAQALSENNKDG